jgi:hypothetical protein
VTAASQGRAWRARLTREIRELLDDPVEAIVLGRERVAERHELKAKRTRGVGGFMPWPPCPYIADADWEQRIHVLIGAPWPCPAHVDFWALWPEVLRSLEAKGLALGRGAFAGWGDGEPALTRVAYCLTLHLRPTAVVETGVGRGITTRFILEAFERNGGGHLWSIDLPPIGEPKIHDQTAAAVPAELRHRWTYIRGSSRRRLRPLLDQLGSIDLFVHDSRHTQRNLLYELEQATRALTPSGALLADDVDLNCGFHEFVARRPDLAAVLCRAEPLRPDVGRQDDAGIFGLSLKRE